MKMGVLSGFTDIYAEMKPILRPNLEADLANFINQAVRGSLQSQLCDSIVRAGEMLEGCDGRKVLIVFHDDAEPINLKGSGN